ncbi:MAG: hypothetical protein NVS3B20_12260 [Polyangiales bacterium]
MTGLDACARPKTSTSRVLCARNAVVSHLQNLGRALSLAFSGAALFACAGTAPSKVISTPSVPESERVIVEDHSGFESKGFGAYRSDRLGITVPLPDRDGWSISDRDDAAFGWLVATHPPTGTVVRARRFEETSLVGRLECEVRAQLIGELPKEEARESGKFETLADEPIRRPKGWDGRRWVAIETNSVELRGHVFLVTGRAHSCLVVHVIAKVRSDIAVNDLADRLELFASRVVGQVAADRAEEPRGISPVFPNAPPPRDVP